MPHNSPGISVLCFQESLEIENWTNKLGRYKWPEMMPYKIEMRTRHGRCVGSQMGGKCHHFQDARRWIHVLWVLLIALLEPVLSTCSDLLISWPRWRYSGWLGNNFLAWLRGWNKFGLISTRWQAALLPSHRLIRVWNSDYKHSSHVGSLAGILRYMNASYQREEPPSTFLYLCRS